MTSEALSDVKFEIGHILFIDIVGYSKLLIHEQSEHLELLRKVVRGTEQVRLAEAEGKLLRLPTGDGGALVFRNSAEAPVLCAVEISRALKQHRQLRIRMGIHSGPVNAITDLNEQANIAGAGIDIAQRVMDCGDAGHILLSTHVADDLAPFYRWSRDLHPLGDCEVKHGQKIGLVNFYTKEIGNPSPPIKCRQAQRASRRRQILIGAAGLLLLLIVMGSLFRLATRHGSVSSSDRRTRLGVADKSIAVLPFDNLSAQKENAYFADGVQDEILTALAKVADLKVISRTSVMQYKSGISRNLREIANQLGVVHVLEGSVQRAASRIRVNAQLIDARTDAHLWAQTYDRELADVFAVQTEIAKAIADQLQAKILPQEKSAIEQRATDDLAAYDLYAQASQLVDRAIAGDIPKQDLIESIVLLNKATEHDPKFVLAYCKLGRAHDQLYLLGLDHSAERLQLAEQAISSAIRLAPSAPEAHLARATHLYSKLDYDSARAELEQTRQALPNDPRALELTAYVDRRQGRWPESNRNLERALELDPNNVFMLQQIATSYGNLREYDKAAAALDRIIAIKPQDFATRLARAQLEITWKADTKPMHDVIEKYLSENPNAGSKIAASRVFLALAERDPVLGMQAMADMSEETFGPDALQYPKNFYEGLFARLKGDEAAAVTAFTEARAVQQEIVDKQPDYAPALCVLGTIDAGLGRKDDAVREGRRAVELMPPGKDSINGSAIITRLAMIYAWIGEKDLAIQELEHSLRFPNRLSYGQLKLFSQWDPLRGDPRFEQIVASLAPNAKERER